MNYVYSWGDNDAGTLGVKIRAHRKKANDDFLPERVSIKSVTNIFTGLYHSFAATKKGLLYAFGLNNY